MKKDHKLNWWVYFGIPCAAVAVYMVSSPTPQTARYTPTVINHYVVKVAAPVAAKLTPPTVTVTPPKPTTGFGSDTDSSSFKFTPSVTPDQHKTLSEGSAISPDAANALQALTASGNADASTGGYNFEGIYVPPRVAAAAQPPVTAPQYQKVTTCYIGTGLSYSELRQCIEVKPSPISGITAVKGTGLVKVRTAEYTLVTVNVPGDAALQILSERAIANGIRFDSQEPPFDIFGFLAANSWLIIIALMIGFFLYNRKRAGAIGGGSRGAPGTNFGTNKAKDYKESRGGQKKLSFDDIRGCPEAVEHGKTFIEMHEHDFIFKAHKAPFPRGYLLVGPPGVGKSLFVRTLADSLDGDAFITAGSEFVEMYVGVGASRARDLFEKAKAKAALTIKPVIIFIDEIDAVGGKRGISKNDERESTLNQLLVEMDGLLEMGNILIIGATNRPDMLDPALLRRLASRIVMDKPDLAGRRDILDLYVSKIAIGPDVTLDAMAKRTYDFSGDQLKKSVDYAVTLAAKRCSMLRKLNNILRSAKVNVEPATMSDFDRAFDFIQYGDELPSKQKNLSEKNKRNTSVHEACHGVVAHRLAELGWCDPVVKATIMRRSRTLGFVMTMPQEERTGWDHRSALARIIVAMAGRAGQEVFLNTKDSGASGDFQQATDLAREMVMNWGMSDNIGFISIGARPDGGNVQTGLALQDRVDADWTKLCNDCYAIAKEFVKAEKARVKVVANLLDKQETILEAEWNTVVDAIPSEYDPSQNEMFGALPGYEEGLLA